MLREPSIKNTLALMLYFREIGTVTLFPSQAYRLAFCCPISRLNRQYSKIPTRGTASFSAWKWKTQTRLTTSRNRNHSKSCLICDPRIGGSGISASKTQTGYFWILCSLSSRLKITGVTMSQNRNLTDLKNIGKKEAGRFPAETIQLG